MQTRKLLSLLTALVMSLGLLFTFFGVAAAHTHVALHAKVDGGTPKPGSTIATAPTTVMVHTAENMKTGAQNSNLFVYSPSGELISTGDAKIDINNPQQMSVAIKPTGNGMYIVRWVTVSADDGDPDQGAYTFTVGTTAATTVSAPAKSTPAPAPSGTPVWVPILIGIVALLIGLGAGVAFGSRRSTPATASTTSPGVVPEKERTTQRP